MTTNQISLLKYVDSIKYPLLSEKSFILIEEHLTYTFVVAPTITKPQIKEAIEYLFDVKVQSVRTLIEPTKKNRVGRFLGKKPQYKKAFVTLQEGSTIQLFTE